jgi:hypothetical protein
MKVSFAVNRRSRWLVNLGRRNPIITDSIGPPRLDYSNPNNSFHLLLF